MPPCMPHTRTVAAVLAKERAVAWGRTEAFLSSFFCFSKPWKPKRPTLADLPLRNRGARVSKRRNTLARCEGASHGRARRRARRSCEQDVAPRLYS